MKIKNPIKEILKMSQLRETFQYTFGEIILIGKRLGHRYKTTWYLVCPECKGEHMFRQTGSKVWHTSCALSDIEWTITPREFYTCKPVDFSLILGAENGDR